MNREEIVEVHNILANAADRLKTLLKTVQGEPKYRLIAFDGTEVASYYQWEAVLAHLRGCRPTKKGGRFEIRFE